MKVFVSSVVKGMEADRDAAARAARALKHEVLRSEDFGASPSTPQQVCLGGVRAADVVLLLLGERYGAVQPSGLSPTHEEFREAKDRCSVLVFVKANASREPQQEQFLTEVQAWGSGLYTARYSDPEDLRDAVTSALHQLELSRKTGPVDPVEMLARAKQSFPRRTGSDARLIVCVVGAPAQQILRPADIEEPALAKDLTRELLFGTVALFHPRQGTQDRIADDRLEVVQDDRSVAIDPMGTVTIQLPAQEDGNGSFMLGLLEEFVMEQAEAALRFADWLLAKVDPTHRIQEVAPVVGLVGASHLGWKTRDEQRRSPNTASIGLGSGDEIEVHLQPPNRRREVLHTDPRRLAEDLLVLLRRRKRR